jgi:hypothetical protein
MIIDATVSLETQSIVDCCVVPVALIVIREPSSQMCCDEAELGVGELHTDCNSAFVARDARHARLPHTTFDILYLGQYGGLDEDAEGCSDELATPQKHVLLASNFFGMLIQGPLNSLLPSLLSSRVTVHDLLGTQLHDLLEPNGNDLGLRVAKDGRADPGSQVFINASQLAIEVKCSHPSGLWSITAKYAVPHGPQDLHVDLLRR